MRLRNVKGSRETIENSHVVINNEKDYKGKWKELFKNDNPIYIEIGMGKGKFIIEQAKTHKDINFIGIEKYSSVLVRAIEKYEEEEINNLYFIRMDAETIEEVFDEGEISKIYLNFSDPWPKDRHEKRRLTSKEFLARYNKVLVSDGVVEFKTDNRTLFDFSLEQVPIAGWKLKYSTYDLHNSEYLEGNIMTEYETKFVAMGNAINKMVIYR